MDFNQRKVRINKVTIQDFKSVANGSINFNVAEALRQGKPCVMGIYGQNGSGKTVIIEALSIFKCILSGKSIPNQHLETISKGKDSCSLSVELAIVADEHTDCIATYSCELARRKDPNSSTTDPKSILAVISESVKISGLFGGKTFRSQFIAETDENCKLIRPENKAALLYGKDNDTLRQLEKQKVLALYGSRSFIFSEQSIEALKNMGGDMLFGVIASIRLYAINKLFVIGEQTGSPLVISFIREDERAGVAGQFHFRLDSKDVLSTEALSIFMSLIPPLNSVLSSIIPGLTILCKSQKSSVDENDDQHEVELFSQRDELGIFPFKHESLGIKKILSFIVMLIEAYNNPSFTLAIDELDSSIFEYLVGELVSIMNVTGQGQLIFTSHNLRPLEMLEWNSITFTTTNRYNRYSQIKTKKTNNLRDVYFRKISIGSDETELYDGVSKNKIAQEFRMARSDH